jgi:hypothetical protein
VRVRGVRGEPVVQRAVRQASAIYTPVAGDEAARGAISSGAEGGGREVVGEGVGGAWEADEALQDVSYVSPQQ